MKLKLTHNNKSKCNWVKLIIISALLLYYIISISILIKCHEINNMLKSQNQYIIDINEDMDNVDSELEIINSNLNEFDTRLNNIESELPMQTNNNMEE